MTQLDQRKFENELEELRKKNAELENQVKKFQENEALSRAILSGGDGLFYSCSQNYHIEFISNNLIDRLGYDPTGELCHKSMHILDDICPWCVHKKVLNGETLRSEVLSPHDRRWYSVVNTPIYYDDGRISNLAMMTDVTESKSTIQALKDAHYIISKSPAVAFLWKNSAGWPVEFVTDNVMSLFGYSAGDFMSGKIAYSDVVHPEDLDRVGQEVATFSAERDRDHFEHKPYRIVTRQGQIRWIEDRTFIRRNSKGDITHYQGIVEDITERKKTEESLRLAKYCIDEASIGIYRMAQDGRILDVNQTAYKYLGYTREELCSMTVFDIDPEFDREKWKKHRQELQFNGVKLIESKHRKKDGTVFPVEILINYHELNGEGFSHTFVIDITGRKKAEEEKNKLQKQLLLAQKMEAVGLLAGGIAHDFNNILQIIAGNAQLLLSSWDANWPGYNRLRQIERSSLKASDLTRRLLTYSRNIESNLRPLSLNEEVKKVIAILERSLPKMIKIEYYLDNALYDVNADPLQIEQILMNVAINAQHAMPGGGKLIIETKNASLNKEFSKTHLGAKEGEYAALIVSDNGMGMSQGTKDRIYDPFFTTKKVGEGTGLGLSMVYGIVKNHGGYIKCDSELGKGTTFTIFFPATNISPTHDIEEKTLEPCHQGNWTETILIVDDDPAVLELINTSLSQNGYQTLTAFSGEEAIDIYRFNVRKINLVILDLNMPGMGGSECLEELLHYNPEVKVIVASGFSPDGKLRNMLESNRGDFIGKPFQITDMLEKIRKVLDSQKESNQCVELN